MKRLFQVASALLLSALLTAPAFAAGFKSDMACEFSPGQGATTIAPNGTLHINMNNLEPNTEFVCGVFCEIFGDEFFTTCTTNNKGHFSVSFPGAVDICIGPVVIVFNSDFCANGVVVD